MRKINNKKAAFEMTMGTIVIIVLAVSMLVLGLVLTKKIMCSGLVMTDQIDSAVQSQITSMFEGQEYGVKCMGEPGSAAVKLGGGGQRQVICIINTDQSGNYDIKITSLTKIGVRGVSQTIADGWLIERNGFQGEIKSGSKSTRKIGTFELPNSADTTNVELAIHIIYPDGTSEDKTSSINIVPAGFVTSALC